MDKETLSNYGWIVICVLVLAVMLALATPFGSFIAGAIKSTTAGLFGVNQAALGSAGIDVNDMVFENCDHLETEVRNATDTYTGDTCCKACGAVLQAGQIVRAKVPEGGKYTAADGTVYNPGDEMPEVCTNNDEYAYEDYKYRYEEENNGWHVFTKREQASYGYILETINGQPITNMYQTFAYIDNDFTLPSDFKIPDTVRNVKQLFYYSDITTLPENFTFPEGVVSLQQTFYGTNLIDASNIVIPSTVTDMSVCFYQCTKLVKAPQIPAQVTNIVGIFDLCHSLNTYDGSTDPDGDFSNYVIPNGVTSLYHSFRECTSMVVAPSIPNTVTNMELAFSDCTSLVTAPIIPSSVDDLSETFKGCTSLSGTITINSPIATSRIFDDYTCYNCFKNVDMTNITLTGAASKEGLNLAGATGNNWTPIS